MEVDVLGSLNSPYNFSGRKAKSEEEDWLLFLKHILNDLLRTYHQVGDAYQRTPYISYFPS